MRFRNDYEAPYRMHGRDWLWFGLGLALFIAITIGTLFYGDGLAF